MDRYLARGKHDTGDWVWGYYVKISGRYTKHYIFAGYAEFDCDEVFPDRLDVDPATLGRCTGLLDKDGKMIYEGDITELAMPDGDVRRFEVKINPVIREVVSHPDFDAPTAKVAITGVVFTWNGYDLFPCVDENGMIDTEKMSIIGNIHDNPDLLGEEAAQ